MWQPIKIKASNVGSLKDFEYSFVNGCTVIQGENIGDKGQKSNGSGKSIFFDIPGIIIIGSSILGKESVKNIVNWSSEQKFMEMEMKFRNDLLKSDLWIKRRVYKNTKSEELSITVNGELPPELPTKKGVSGAVDVREGNKFILETIGISRDDILDRYLIAPDDYTSFFKLSGKKRQEIIERFANVNPVDIAISKMEKEEQDWLLKWERNESLLTRKESEIEIISEQIEGLKETDLYKQWKDQIDLSIQHLNREILEWENEIEPIDSDNEKNQEDRVLYRELIEAIEEDIKLLNIDKDKKSEDIKSLNVDKDKKSEELTGIESSIEEINDTLFTVKEQEVEYKAYLKHKIQCPKCNHNFIIDNDITVEEAESFLQDLDETLIVINDEKTGINENIKKINDEGSKIYENIKKIKDERSKIDDSISDLNREKRESDIKVSEIDESINSNIRKREGNERKIKGNKDLITVRKTDEFEDVQTSKLNDKLKSAKKELSALKKSTKEFGEEKTKRVQWQNNFKDLKFQIINKRVKSLSGLINYHLEKNGSDLSIEIEGFKELKSKEIRQELTPRVYRNGTNPQPYSQFSGGEKVRLNIAADMAFQELINANSETGGLNYYQNDEVLNPLDSLGVENAAKAFDSIDKPILLVTHSGSEIAYKKVITIVKENGISSVV